MLFHQTGFSKAGSQSGAQTREYSLRERAMRAGEQLREFRHLTATQAAKARSLDQVSQSRPEAGIRINKEMQTSSTVFFYDNMEGGANGWTTQAFTGTDAWHQSTINSSSPAHSWWPGLEGQLNYNDGRINDALISPAIDLTGATGSVTLLFTESYVTELGWDYCMVDVSTDGGSSWTHLRGAYGSAPSGNSGGWQITELDLSPYAGQSVRLRFYFDTGDDKFNEFPGWFVDDVVVFDQGGTITGKKFFDVNNNSQKDTGERGIKDWPITATGPVTITTRTNYRGRYTLTLPLGTYTVSEAFQPNWTQTYPLSGTWTVDLATPDTLVDSVHFGNYIHASFINGRKFHDLNQSGFFDGGDTLIPEWKIILADTNGNEIDFDRTDSLGEYSLYVFAPGRYIVREVNKNGWVQSYPPGEQYTIDIPDLSTVSNGNDFGNYYSPLTNSILGQKFNDRNRSGTLDAGELGVSGFKIQLMRKNGTPNFHNYKQRTTDSSGFYQFLSLPADTYKVYEIPQQGWWQSYPESSHVIVLESGGTLDSIDFGNFEFQPGSVGGVKYNDVNGNGSREGGEGGLGGWRILLDGTTYFNLSVTQSTVTDGNGNYSLTGVWPGTYTVSEVWRSDWRQTQPSNLQPYSVTLGLEENRPGVDFGNTVDSNFSVSFRTFKPESLALAIDNKGKHKPIKRAPDKSQFCFQVLVDTDNVQSLEILFGVPIVNDTDHLHSEPSYDRADEIGTKPLRFLLRFPSKLIRNQVVTVCGYCPKPKHEFIKKYWWWKSSPDSVRGLVHLTGATSTLNELRLPMPNAINMLQSGAGTGLRVGLGGGHSVYHSNYTYVMKSLIERLDRMHIGGARCLDKFSNGASIKKVQKYLTPTKHNNKLLSEAIALQANIAGSDLGLTPGGFGNLVFDDGTGPTNPMNGFTIREIATRLDSFMSSYKDTGANIGCGGYPSSFTAMDPETLWAKIRMIDSAFCGPIDTVSFSTGLKFTQVRPLSDVPFLHLDPIATNRNYVPPRLKSAPVPEQYTLYQNYPNPFNPTTTLSFYLVQPSAVTMTVYNVLGQEVARLLDRQLMEDGPQDVSFDASNLPSGVYFYRLKAEEIADGDGDRKSVV